MLIDYLMLWYQDCISHEDGLEQLAMKSPPPLCINFDKPNNEIAREEHTSRFKC